MGHADVGESEGEVGFGMEPTVFVADDQVIGPGWGCVEEQAESGGVFGNFEFRKVKIFSDYRGSGGSTSPSGRGIRRGRGGPSR